MSLAIPALSGVGSSSLKVGARQISSALTIARSKAISERKQYGVGMVINDPDAPEAAYHALDILTINESTGRFEQYGTREVLPTGIYFEPNQANIVSTFSSSTAGYLANDPGLVVGDYFPDPTVGDIVTLTDIGTGTGVDYKVVMFKPSGIPRVMDSAGGLNSRFIYCVLVKGILDQAGTAIEAYTELGDSGELVNWVHITTDRLTGRVRNFQPDQ